jgi:hypothetical protein
VLIFQFYHDLQNSYAHVHIVDNVLT